MNPPFPVGAHVSKAVKWRPDKPLTRYVVEVRPWSLDAYLVEADDGSGKWCLSSLHMTLIEETESEPPIPCCTYIDHGGRKPLCACTEHERSLLHPCGS